MNAGFMRDWWLYLLLAVAAAGVLTLLFRSAPPERPQLNTLSPPCGNDRLLILAPHEDDETLGCGGLIQQAVARGAAVRVVYLTNGDHNQLAFLLYRKRLWLSPKINRNMGEVRHREATEAMAYLGVPANQLVFLGFPDHDTLGIWNKHWGDRPPLHSVLTNTTRVPYKNSLCYGRPYKGEEIVGAIEQQLREFRPTHVMVTHPADGNPDHRAYYLFLQVALLDLAGDIPAPGVFIYPIHMGPWPRPHKFHPDEWLSFPARLAGESARSSALELTPEQVQRKYHAICLYKSQMTDSASWLTAFARRNELYIAAQPLALGEGSQWTAPVGMSPSSDTAAYELDVPAGHARVVSYRNTPDGLLVKVSQRKWLGKDCGSGLSVFGYRRDTPFANMPKLHIEWNKKKLEVRDGGVAVQQPGVRVAESHLASDILIPWRLMGAPEVVFADVQSLFGPVTVANTGWKSLAVHSKQQAH